MKYYKTLMFAQCLTIHYILLEWRPWYWSSMHCQTKYLTKMENVTQINKNEKLKKSSTNSFCKVIYRTDWPNRFPRGTVLSTSTLPSQCKYESSMHLYTHIYTYPMFLTAPKIPSSILNGIHLKFNIHVRRRCWARLTWVCRRIIERS